MIEYWKLQRLHLNLMHFKTKIQFFSFFFLLDEKQLMKNIRLWDEKIELLNKKFTLLIQSLYHRNNQIYIFRIVLTHLIFRILTFYFDYLHNSILNKWKIYLLYEVFLVSVKLGVDSELAHLDCVLIEHQNREIFIENLLVLVAFSNES
jgi:hypothetical protein